MRDKTLQHRTQRKNYQADKASYRARNVRRVKAIRDHIIAYKSTHPCVDCGNDNWIVLDFDHRPGEKKLYKIANTSWLTMAKLEAEIVKCDVRCANCHRLITYARRLLKKAGLVRG